MKSNRTLTFDALERQLAIVPFEKMLKIFGGGNYDTIDEIVHWASEMGIPFTVDGNSQYTDSSGNILISPVEVFAWANNHNTSTGPGPSPTTTIIYTEPSDYETQNAYIKYFESLGYEMIQNDDGSYYCASTPHQQTSDPWKRDAEGNIIAQRTETDVFVYDVYGDNALLEEYKITAANGTLLTVYKVIGIKDPITGNIRPANENEMSNCIGFALTDGEYMFADNLSTPTTSEGEIVRNQFEPMFAYEECSKAEATVVMVYSSSDSSAYVIHAGIVNEDGTYDAKGGGSQFYIRRGMTESEFYKPYPSTTDPETGAQYQVDYSQGTTVYYKPKY